MADCKEKLFTEFPPVSTETWMEKVTADLKGADFNRKLVWKTQEGFSVKPMYRAEDIKGLKTTESLPGEFPYVRGTKNDNHWLVRQEIDVEDLKQANQKAKDILQKGVSSIGFHLSKDQINAQSIAELLDGINPEEVELNFKSCNKLAENLINVLAKYYKEKGVDLNKAKGSVNFDAVGAMIKRGFEVPDFADMMAKVIEAGKALPKYTVITIGSDLLNNAGAYISQELGYALAWGNDILAKMTEKGIDIDTVAKDIKFNMGIGSNYFMEIAKFRAARMLWAQIVSQYKPVCGCAAKMKVNATTSEFNMTIFDANVNMLRSQTEAMSAALAGVDSIVVTPYDKCYKTPDVFSERIARNQQLLLKEESHLDKSVDPSAGSYYIENLTVSIAQQAWKEFLDLEDKGGFIANVLNGEIQKAVNASSEKRKAAASSRKESLLGTNQFPNFNETANQKIEKTEECKCQGNHTQQFEKVNLNRLATDFEELRLATEKAAKRPKAFMLTIGNLAMRLARAQFSCNFFGCAGYENIDNLGFETVEQGVEAAFKADADIIVLCSSDDEYAELAPKAFELIGDKAIFVVAGAPACMEDLKAVGINNYINVKSNVLETLKSFNAQLLK
ncbi:MAG: methylmalonyl-CoA mutase small subunit [Bacteroidales bacterium]|nr:methylmalonyl-CoA mutase small subunit [Bacteroidales bacterium]